MPSEIDKAYARGRADRQATIDARDAQIKTLRARVADLEAQIAEHERVCAGTWVPVGDMTPDLGPAVLAYRPTALYKIYWQCISDNGRWFEMDGTPTITPSHVLEVNLPTSSGEGA